MEKWKEKIGWLLEMESVQSNFIKFECVSSFDSQLQKCF